MRGGMKKERELLESTLILNQDGVILWVSSSINIVLGYLPEEIVGKEIFSLVYKRSPKKIRELFRETQKDQALLNVGLKQFIGKNDETIPLFVTLSSISGFQEMSGTLVRLRHFNLEENAANISLLLDEVEIEIELRRKIEQEIATELHDHVSSGLAAVKLILDFSLQNTSRSHDILEELSITLGNLISDTRNLSHTIAKRASGNFELHETLDKLIRQVTKVSAVRVVLKYDKTVEALLKSNQKIHVARIIQEQVMIIIKHANASKVLISVQYKFDKIVAVTRDNGKGFDMEKQHDGIGLTNMYYRVNLLGGNMHINSKCGVGTTFVISVPVK